ncbi:MAG: hypothetical protein U9R00_01470 [Patescibacteria group bacterium]|nr:hypothetical protein [Patescibacteria group bacterium]
MNSETRTCQNCKKNFVIESEDFSFYEKMKVPAPTFCSECRQMRRMSFRNERNLFRRKCDKTGENIISVFSADSPHKVYSRKYWDTGEFDPMTKGRDFDFSRPFFDQFKEFLLDMPFPAVRVGSSENCEYNNDMSKSQNCYLCTRTHICKDMMYVYRGNSSSNCVDCMQVVKGSDLLYECVECLNCSNSSYLYFSENCSSSSFLYNCKNCFDCFMCSNLRNKQYYFKNEQYSKEEYQQKISEFNLGSNSSKEKAIWEFENFNKNTIRKNLNIINSVNCTGDNIVDSKNTFLSFGAKFIENSRYLWDVMKYKDSMDSYSGGRDSQIIYECTATAAAYNCSFCVRASDSRDISYSMYVKNCQNLFGCLFLQNKEYCIFNKQYSEEEYKDLKEKIIEHMKKTGEYGEFFPMTLSMFQYNQTVAHEYFPLTKEQILEKGLKWRDSDDKNYNIDIRPEGLPDNIEDVDKDILNKVIGCDHKGNCDHGCTTAFKLTPAELDFYKRMNISLPRLCSNCRHYGRLNKKNPLKLWHRTCMKEGCNNEFETSYSPDREEIVYCESCYQKEVY